MALTKVPFSMIKEAPQNPSNQGAVGDGSTDDTDAINDTVALNTSIDLLGYTYSATPTLGASLVNITATGASVTNGNMVVKSGTYYRGVAGQIDSYAYTSLSNDAGIIFKTTFDGNSQATIDAYQPAGQNVYFYPALLYGNKKGQKAIANHMKNNGGHAVEGSSGSLMIIGVNSAEGHNGIGTTNSASVAVVGNVSANVSDSHYYLNTTNTTAVTGNTGQGAIAGGGVDIAGGENIGVCGNTFTGAKKHGLWVLKSPNTSTQYKRVLLSGNISFNNCNYPDNDQGEIVIGDFNHIADAQGETCAVIGNLVYPQDTPATAGYNAGVLIHPKAKRTAVSNNVFDGYFSETAPAAYSVYDRGAEDTTVANNISLVPSSVYFTTPSTGKTRYVNNINMRIAAASPPPAIMKSEDGIWEYHITRVLTKTDMTVMDISFPGGATHYLIELVISAHGISNGVIKNTIAVFGYNAVTPTILSNVADISAGANPPVLTLDTGTTNRLRIKAKIAAAGTDSQITAFRIRITSPYDAPSLFTPVFV